MDAAARVTLITGFATAAVAILGYWVNQHAARRERKAQTYAGALSAVAEYEELPYLIRRRSDSANETRAAITQKQSEVFHRIRHSQALLDMESGPVGYAYRLLFMQTRRQGGPYRKEAWSEDIITSDAGIPDAAYYPYDNEPELELCIKVMRRELAPFAPLLRSVTRRQIKKLEQNRPRWQAPAWMSERWNDVINDERHSASPAGTAGTHPTSAL
ncbi:hypothetical protein [Streptomyces griseoaurantiacus]|uniref:hypothetical protein n=1 Tax=Streptomyces griseoaurantiacus TaxID=68213 RepID=UPI001782754B|nr:hypothetical protein GCM10018782_46180 [Streptomyces griseoaurantiacus]